jgi:hypothetical protein
VTLGIRVTAGAIGSVIDLRTARTGWVHSVFTHAVNLELGEEMWTVVAHDGHDAALTLRLSGVVVPGDLRLRIQDPVYVRSSHVRAGASVIDTRTAVRWMPQMYDVDPCGLGDRAAELEAAARHVAWEGSWTLADAVAGALECGGRSDLEEAVRRAVGRGPGLTPAVTTCSRASSRCSPRPELRSTVSHSRLGFAPHSHPPCPPPTRSAVRCWVRRPKVT